MKIANHFKGVCGLYLKWNKKNRKIISYNQLDLETLGSQLIALKNLLGHLAPMYVISIVTKQLQFPAR